jgi:hypothetical protein
MVLCAAGNQQKQAFYELWRIFVGSHNAFLTLLNWSNIATSLAKVHLRMAVRYRNLLHKSVNSRSISKNKTLYLDCQNFYPLNILVKEWDAEVQYYGINAQPSKKKNNFLHVSNMK